MKPKLILCLALVLSGGLFGCATATSRHAKLEWGDSVNGLQMAASFDESSGIIHCWIRNGTTAKVNYPVFDIGYLESVNLEVQETTNCVRLRVQLAPSSGGNASAGSEEIKPLKPGQIIKDTDARRRFILPKNQTYAEWLIDSHGDTNEALLNYQSNDQWISHQKLADKLTRRDTFALDLNGAEWPLIFPRKHSFTARVSQSFRVFPAGEKIVTLYSPDFKLDSSLIESLSDKSPHYKIILQQQP